MVSGGSKLRMARDPVLGNLLIPQAQVCVCVYVVKKEQDFIASLRLILYFIVVELYFILLSLTGTILFIFSCWDVDLQVVGGERRIPVQMVRVTTILKLWVFLVKCNYEDGRS